MKNIMTLAIALMALVATTATAKTARQDGDTVRYTVLHNYFHNNDAPLPSSPLITTQQEFDAQFGMAAFMGKDGQPTRVNFKRQAVVAIVLPVTNRATDIDSVSIRVTGDRQLTLAYTVHEGLEQGYSTQPVQLMAIDKRYRGYEVNVVPTVRHETTLTETAYDFVSLNDARHDVRIAVDYPKSDGSALTDSLQAYINGQLASLTASFSLSDARLTPTEYRGKGNARQVINFYGQVFADSIDVINREIGQMFNHCALVANIQRVYEDDRYVSYESSGYFYLGGAHGLSFCDGATFDKASGRQLKLVKDDPQLRKLLTERLHKNVDVPSFNEEPVPMPQNAPYVVAGKKIKFVYQPYEIGPYAIGMPDCELYPFEIDDYLTTEGKALEN